MGILIVGTPKELMQLYKSFDVKTTTPTKYIYSNPIVVSLSGDFSGNDNHVTNH